jgi:hypothetical protein
MGSSGETRFDFLRQKSLELGRSPNLFEVRWTSRLTLVDIQEF